MDKGQWLSNCYTIASSSHTILIVTSQPASIERYSCEPYSLTFKENGCIIFIAALTSDQIIVTSKHALGSDKSSGPNVQEADEQEVDEIQTSGSSQSAKPTHAGKGAEWLERHLSKVGKTKSDLAAELWKRGQTAVAELCDDSFEEHVLAYPPEKSGLHLHGLNSNTVDFHTQPMEEVEKFALDWGFIPTRYITLQSMQEVKEFTDRVGTTGEWQGEAIEGFVVRTRIPADAVESSTKEEGIAAPPYSPNQVWFYKVKYDEPYLMYRDWRELAKKMLTERTKWQKECTTFGRTETQGAAASKQEVLPSMADISLVDEKGQPKSKNQIKREKQALGRQNARRIAEARGHPAPQVPLPQPPRARSNRPETRLFIEWCYEKLYGNADGNVKPNLTLFEGINVGKGIIHLRDTFLRYLESGEGRKKLNALGGARGALAVRLGETASKMEGISADVEAVRSARPFTHLLVVPIAVPGCGKTSLFVALRHLFSGLIGHTQSDDVQAKKTGPQFLKNICEELAKFPIVLADRNNHLLKHRDEIVEAVRAWEERGGKSEEEIRAAKKAQHKSKQKGEVAKALSSDDETPKPRVKIVALSWSLDLLALNTLHRLMADRIVKRGSNHQSLVADTKSAAGSRSHETILWRFLESLETLGHAEGKGEGDRGRGDAAIDRVLRLNVEVSQEEQLRVVCDEVIFQETKDIATVHNVPEPSAAQRNAALDAAREYKVKFSQTVEQQNQNVNKGEGRHSREPRYFGLAVELDLGILIPALLSGPRDHGSDQEVAGAATMFETLRQRDRVITRPHITLVHSSNLKAKDGAAETKELKATRRRWEFYKDLVSQGRPVDFDIELGNLVYDDRVMAFSIKSVYPSDNKVLDADEFWKIQGGRGDSTGNAAVDSATWHPHITVGTMDESIRPFEANRVMREAEAHQRQKEQAGDDGSGGGVHLVGTPTTIKINARLAGLFS